MGRKKTRLIRVAAAAVALTVGGCQGPPGPPGPAGPPGPPGPPGGGGRQVFDSSPVPQLVGDYAASQLVILDEGGTEFYLGLKINALGTGFGSDLFFDDNACAGSAFMDNTSATLDNVIPPGILRGSLVYVVTPGSATQAYTRRAILEPDGTCNNIADAPGNGRPAAFVKDISSFVPPFTIP